MLNYTSNDERIVFKHVDDILVIVLVYIIKWTKVIQIVWNETIE